MGRFKTEAQKQNQTVRRAHKMAGAFAKHKTKEFLSRFLNDSSLVEFISELADLDQAGIAELKLSIQRELDLPFGGALALAYAMGFMDHAEGKNLKELYIVSEEKKSALIMPGQG